MKVLIVEDEALLAEEIAVSLAGRQFQCDMASSAAEALSKTDTGHYEFILLDIGLPDKDGFYLLKEIRKDHPESAIIILTTRGQVEDRIKGLDMGADDYLSKPFSLLELQSRMMAITRRKYNLNDTLTVVGAFELDIRNRLIRYEDQDVDLSKKEFDLLSYLVLHKNRPLSMLQLSEHLWGDFSDEGNDSNYIDVHIKNIRKKLGVYAPVDWLETVRGIGYKIKIE
jgi:DNA-binding response OmpR family regulator